MSYSDHNDDGRGTDVAPAVSDDEAGEPLDPRIRRIRRIRRIVPRKDADTVPE